MTGKFSVITDGPIRHGPPDPLTSFDVLYEREFIRKYWEDEGGNVGIFCFCCVILNNK
jgi:hypothetical protein